MVLVAEEVVDMAELVSLVVGEVVLVGVEVADEVGVVVRDEEIEVV